VVLKDDGIMIPADHDSHRAPEHSQSLDPSGPTAAPNPRGAWISLLVWFGGFLFLILLLFWDLFRPLFGL
jgi:hypothetical protein